MTLTWIYTTARPDPKLHWLVDSLRNQLRDDDVINLIVVDFYAEIRLTFGYLDSLSNRTIRIKHVPVKPNVWQGKHRLAPQDSWACSSARNTGLCLSLTSHTIFTDDRCVLLPGTLAAVREAVQGNYVCAGAYEKRHNMTVENGIIKHGGVVVGEDSREQYTNQHWAGKAPADCGGEWLFGCFVVVPTEWALAVNGYEELCDGLGMEDIIFGKMLQNAGYPVKYDKRMKMVEDRTPSECGPVMEKTSKEKHSNDKTDKGHAALKRFMSLKRTEHHWNLREVRKAVLLSGESFPVPTEPVVDWFDGMPIKDMKIQGGRIV